MNGEKKYWLDDRRNVDKLFRGLILVCAGLFLADLIHSRHPHFGWDGWIGFFGVYGFVACVLLVLTAKQLRKILMRREDFYDR